MLTGVTVYGLLAVSRVLFQVASAGFERKKQYGRKWLPKAVLIVPTYNEDPILLDPAFKSFKQQTYKKLSVIVVDDGSKNADEVKKLARKYSFKYIHQDNAGKREAMNTAFEAMDDDVEVVLTADSDTIWDKRAAAKLTRILLNNEKYGAVTGEVAVLNNKDNFLTRLIDIRYHLAFAHERASQSIFGNVTCVSGPLGAYRREVIDKIKGKFISQTFLGKRCTYGDDRHLTNLVLNEGYKVKYANEAIAWTYAPLDLKTLVKQQTRWSKSYWREVMWQLRVLPKHGLFLVYDWLITMMLPFVLLYSIVQQLTISGIPTVESVMLLGTTIILMSVLRIIEPLARTRNPIFLLFVSYSFVYFSIMLPVKFYALFTLNDVKWGTR